MVYKSPLKWPANTPRATNRKSARFGAKARGEGFGYKSLSPSQALDRLASELRRLGVRDMESEVIVLTAMKPSLAGMVIPDQAQPNDPGVVVHWEVAGKQRTMAIDIYDRTADNIAAVAAVLEYLRGVERHGGTAVQEQAFAGFDALPPPDSCWKILELDEIVVRRMRANEQFVGEVGQLIKDTFRSRAREQHGHGADMDRLVRARDEALKQIGAA